MVVAVALVMELVFRCTLDTAVAAVGMVVETCR